MNCRNSIKRTFFVLLFVVGSLSLTGCAVAPWERGNLAKKQMLIDPNPNRSALRNHVFDSKESSQGGMGGSGGGCGCN